VRLQPLGHLSWVVVLLEFNTGDDVGIFAKRFRGTEPKRDLVIKDEIVYFLRAAHLYFRFARDKSLQRA